MADENETFVPRKRGFAAMDPEKRREIARKGGEAVSQNRTHMAEIGRKGGEARNRGGNPNVPEGSTTTGGEGVE